MSEKKERYHVDPRMIPSWKINWEGIGAACIPVGMALLFWAIGWGFWSDAKKDKLDNEKWQAEYQCSERKSMRFQQCIDAVILSGASKERADVACKYVKAEAEEAPTK